MPRLEIEKFSLEGIEKEPENRRFALILEDSWPQQQMWLMAFFQTPNLRCIVPVFDENWIDDLCTKIDLARVDLVIIDWFLDNWGLNAQGQAFLGRFRAINPHAFVVETSARGPRHGERVYQGSNISCDSFKIYRGGTLKPIREHTDNTITAKLFALQQLLVPSFQKRQELERNLGKTSEDELRADLEKVMTNDYVMIILGELALSGDVLREKFSQLNREQKIIFLHCCFDVLGNVEMGKDEMFYTMPLFRMKQILGLGD